MSDDTKPSQGDDLATKVADYESKITEYEDRITKMDAKIQELLDEKKKEAQKRKEAETEAARKKGDIEAVEQALREEFAKREKEFTEALHVRDDKIQELLVDNEATTIAADLAVDHATVPRFAQLLKSDMTVVERDGTFKTSFLVDGKPSGLTRDEYVGRLKTDPSLARFIRASNANGGGAAGHNGTTPAEPVKNPFGKDGNLTEGAKLMRENPQRAKQLMREAGLDAE